MFSGWSRWVLVARRLARGARLFKVPWVMVASTSVSVRFAVRTAGAGDSGAVVAA